MKDTFFRRRIGNYPAYRPVTIQSGRFSYRIEQSLTNNANSGAALRETKAADRYLSSRLEDGIRSQKQGSHVSRAQSAEPLYSMRIKQTFTKSTSPNLFPQSSSLSAEPVYNMRTKQTFTVSTSPNLFPQPSSLSTVTKPESWVQKQYFSRPASVINEASLDYSTTGDSLAESRYVKHSQSEVGRPSITWMSTVPPCQWPQEATRPNTGKIISLTDSRYLQSLNSKILEALEGRPSFTTTTEERLSRQLQEKRNEEVMVRGLCTPKAGIREQLLEEILRQLQGDGPMEELQERLARIDHAKTGMIGIKEFRSALNGLGEKGVLQEKHYAYLLEQAGSRVESGRHVVQYNHFLELLRLARNRAMASLQKVTDVKKKGLMRWMHVRSVRILKVWKTYAQSRRSKMIMI